MVGSSDSNQDFLAPKWLVIPTIPAGQQSNAQAPTGSIAMSGAFLIFHNGTSWKNASVA